MNRHAGAVAADVFAVCECGFVFDHFLDMLVQVVADGPGIDIDTFAGLRVECRRHHRCQALRIDGLIHRQTASSPLLWPDPGRLVLSACRQARGRRQRAKRPPSAEPSRSAGGCQWGSKNRRRTCTRVLRGLVASRSYIAAAALSVDPHTTSTRNFVGRLLLLFGLLMVFAPFPRRRFRWAAARQDAAGRFQPVRSLLEEPASLGPGFCGHAADGDGLAAEVLQHQFACLLVEAQVAVTDGLFRHSQCVPRSASDIDWSQSVEPAQLTVWPLIVAMSMPSSLGRFFVI